MKRSCAGVVTRGRPDVGASAVEPDCRKRFQSLLMVLCDTFRACATSACLWPACKRPIAFSLAAARSGGIASSFTLGVTGHGFYSESCHGCSQHIPWFSLCATVSTWHTPQHENLFLEDTCVMWAANKWLTLSVWVSYNCFTLYGACFSHSSLLIATLKTCVSFCAQYVISWDIA